MRATRVCAILLTALAASMLFITPTMSSDSAVSDGDIGLLEFDGDLRINAGSSDNFEIVVVNYLENLNNNIDNSRMVSVGFITVPDVELSVDDADRHFILEGNTLRQITVTIDVGKYATAETYKIGIVLQVKSLQSDSTVLVSDTVFLELTILSPLSSGDSYNKILGVFDNPLPYPLDGAIAAAIITFLLWLAIGTLVTLLLVPVLLRMFAGKYKEEGDKMKAALRTFIPIVMILFAFNESLRVYGASEAIIGSVESWFTIFYIMLGAIIAWKIYLIFVHYTVSKISKTKRVDQKDVDIEPLLRLLGKLVISAMTIALIMSVWGFNLTAIITSAGIVSLGITLGAQNILNQFFSGMVLLLTHPFRSGDLVKIGSSSTIYKVSSVNIMNTVFENWDNEETVIMPNNAVSSATIVNLTGDGLIYKITVFMNIGYEDDIDLAGEIMKDVAMNHPNVITNGSVDLPSTRITAFLDSSIELRLTGYVYDFNDSGRIGGELRESIFKSFKENNITIPFPRRDVRLNIIQKDDSNND